MDTAFHDADKVDSTSKVIKLNTPVQQSKGQNSIDINRYNSDSEQPSPTNHDGTLQNFTLSAKTIWECAIPSSLHYTWIQLMGKINSFHKNGFLIPIDNPQLSSKDHYDNMSTDQYRQVPRHINLRIQKIPREYCRTIFRFVPKHIFIDEEQLTVRKEKRAHVQRFRNIPRDVRVQLDKVLWDILNFGCVGLLVPIHNATLSQNDHYRNHQKTNERIVPSSIFRKLQHRSKNEILKLFPRTAGTLTIKQEPGSTHILMVEKNNTVYINSLQLTTNKDLTEDPREYLPWGYIGIGIKSLILNAIPQELHSRWFKLLVEIRRFYHVGLLIPTPGISIPHNHKYHNHSSNGYRHIPPPLYYRIERILTSIPNQRQLQALFPNTRGTIYLNTDPTDDIKPYRYSTNISPAQISSRRGEDIDKIIGEERKPDEEPNNFKTVLGIASINTEDESIIKSIDPVTGAGNITLQAQIQDPELLDLINQQVNEYELILKPLEPSNADQARDRILPPLKREGYKLLPITVAIEGNVGAGKSEMLLDIEANINRLSIPNVHCIQDPQDIWSTYTENDIPILNLAHTQPNKYGFLYLVLQHTIKTASIRNYIRDTQGKEVFVYETSIQSLDTVQNQILKDRGNITSIQSQVYKRLLNEFGNEDIFATDIIYADTPPEQCMNRMEYRSLASYGIVNRFYTEIGKCHLDDWFYEKAKSTRIRVRGSVDNQSAQVKQERIEHITKFLLSRQARSQQSTRCREDKPIIYSFEGNIGSGKTTLLKQLATHCKHQGRNDILVILEPTEEWSKIRTREGPILTLFYGNRTKYSFTFQTLVCTSIRSLLTKLAIENPHIKYFLLERSLLSSRHVFAKMLYDEGSMTDLEFKVYESLFLDKSYEWMNPSKMVYVKTSTPKCAERILKRINAATKIGLRYRDGERLIDHDYLDKCTAQHEQFLFPVSNIEPITIDGDIEEEALYQQTVKDLYDTLFGQDSPETTYPKIEHTYSLRTELSTSSSASQILSISEDDHNLPPEETVLTGVAQIKILDGQVIQATDPLTGRGMVTLTALINNPEVLNWLNENVNEYELILRPIMTDESGSNIDHHFHTLSKGTQLEKPRIIAIEGNIGSGKSTLIEVLKIHCLCNVHANIAFITDPTNTWNKFQMDGKTLLDLYYSEPKTYGFMFQVMAYNTLSKNIRQAINESPTNTIFICEKSLISAQFVYIKYLIKKNLITDIQKKILYKLFREEGVRDISASDIIYLYTKPEYCLGKISRRNADNSEAITLEYLHEYETILNDLYDNSNTDDSLLLENNSTEGTQTPIMDHIEKVMRFITSKKRKIPTYMRLYPTHPEIISIEGNISSGKSSLLKSISGWKNDNNRINDICILWDPMTESDHLETEDGSFSEALIREPTKYSFMRLVAIVTTFRNHLKCIIRDHPDIKYIICENSILTIRWALIDWLRKKGQISPLEIQILEELCDDPTLGWLNPSRTIFLNVSPETCLSRIHEQIGRERSATNEYPESYNHLNLTDITQYRDSLKNMINLLDTIEIDGNHSDPETRQSWVSQITQWMQRL